MARQKQLRPIRVRRPVRFAPLAEGVVALFGEAEKQQAAALLQARALCAPHLVDYEITNVALKKLRRERLAESAVLACLEAYASLDLERHLSGRADAPA